MTDVPEDVMRIAREHSARWANGSEGSARMIAAALIADRAAQAERIRRLEEQIEKLRAAISWIEAPFVNETTPIGELKFRVQQCVLDAGRAALGGNADA